MKRLGDSYPFAAIVGQEELKLALILIVIDPKIGGLLAYGHRGTAKSTAVRGLAAMMPGCRVVKGCPFRCDPESAPGDCSHCQAEIAAGRALDAVTATVPVVDLPLGATEDRLVGTLDFEAALTEARRRFDPGLLARCHRGILYVDEVNLLEDHLVDLLLDVAASGWNVVERESVSIRHRSEFVLVGTANPEEGEIRPQLLDRFGLCTEVKTELDPAKRAEIVRRRLLYEDDPAEFVANFERDTGELRHLVESAKARLKQVLMPEDLLTAITRLNAELLIDGHRGELVLARAVRALAAWEGRDFATDADLVRLARPALVHRQKRETLGRSRIEERFDEALSLALSRSDERVHP